MPNMFYERWKQDLYKTMYGGQAKYTWEKIDDAVGKNLAMQSEMADMKQREMAKYLKDNANVYCVHGLTFNGMWCMSCAEIKWKTRQVQLSTKPPDLIIEGKDVMPENMFILQQLHEQDKTVEATLPDLLVDDTTAAGQVALGYIYEQIGNLTKEQAQELYEKLYNAYNCRIYK